LGPHNNADRLPSSIFLDLESHLQPRQPLVIL
jgi:hypothetical protein